MSRKSVQLVVLALDVSGSCSSCLTRREPSSCLADAADPGCNALRRRSPEVLGTHTITCLQPAAI